MAKLSSALRLILILVPVIYCSETEPDDSLAYLYHWCGPPYESSTSLLNIALTNGFYALFSKTPNNLYYEFVSSNPQVSFMFQCQVDATHPVCVGCVAVAAQQLQALCAGATGGAIQFEGCYLRYGTDLFLGVLNTTLAWSKCGNSIDSEDKIAKSKLFDAMDNKNGEAALVRYENVVGYQQCLVDISVADCQSCLFVALPMLQHQCGYTAFGNIYLDKCCITFAVNGTANGQLGTKFLDKVGKLLKNTVVQVIGAVLATAIISIVIKRQRRSGHCSGEESIDVELQLSGAGNGET